MQLTSLSLALTRAGFLSFSPASLFAAGEPGVWYEPSLTNGTCFQDSSGTTPVTAVEQPVGLILDKSKGLVLGPELVTNGDFSAGSTGWTLGTGWSVSGGKASQSGAGTISSIRQSNNDLRVEAGKYYQLTFTVSDRTAGIVSAFVGNTFVADITSNGTYTRIVFCNSASTTRAVGFDANSTFVGSIDNISVRELPGNHATQTTATSRPVLSARYNLLTKTEQFDDAVWVKQQVTAQTTTATTDPLGGASADIITATASTNFHRVFQTVSFTTDRVQMGCRLALKKGSHRYATVLSATDQGQGWLAATIDLDTGVITKTGVGTSSPAPILTSATSTNLGNGWYEVSIVGTPTPNTANRNFIVYLASSGTPVYGSTLAEDSWAATGTESIYIWGASLVPANQANLPYQRVNTATDYDADPSKFKPYLRFDGVDDWLVTPTITPSTDKAQVFAGVRKLSDAAYPMVFELGTNVNSVNGSFNLVSSGVVPNSPGWLVQVRGTAAVNANIDVGFLSPITNVISGLHDISGDSAILKVNGSQVAVSTSDQGTGNFLAYPLYIGRRGGASLSFNGHLYGLIVRFGANLPAATVASTESWVAGKTGITL